MKNTTTTIHEISRRIGGRLEGPADLEITGIEQIDRAERGDITFIGDAEYAARWPESRASAAIVSSDIELAQNDGRALIRVENTDLAVARMLAMFAPPTPRPAAGVAKSAVVDPAAEIADDVAVGALCSIGARVRIGRGTVVHPSVTILDDAIIGAGCVLWPGVVIRERCELGDGCILHPNVTIGADGFGYRPSADGASLVKIPHIGTVVLGREVELGAGTCIDRGKFSATVIGDGTKIDNLCQIGHNTRIGRCVIIAGLVGIGGSVTIGDGAMIGGCSVIKDHCTVGAGARLGGHSGLMHDIPAGEQWFGFVAEDASAAFRQVAALRKLPQALREMRRAGRSDDR